MFNTIKSRILGVVIALAVIGLVSVAITTQNNFNTELLRLHSDLAKNSIESAFSLVEKKYAELSKLKTNSITERRELMKSVSEAVLKTLSAFRQMAGSGQLTENEAKQKAFQWITNFRYGVNQYFFVCDLNMEGLAHPLPEMTGIKWVGYMNLNFQDTFQELKDKIAESRTIYRVLEWPALPGGGKRKQMALFRHFPEWNWIVGTSTRIDDIEVSVQQKKKAIIHELKSIFDSMRYSDGSRLFLFDEEGAHLINSSENAGARRDTEHIIQNSSILSDASKTGKTIRLKTGAGQPEDSRILYARLHKLSGWSVVLSVSEAKIMIPARRLILKQTYIILAILVIALAALTVICIRITKPLSDLEKLAKTIPEKDLEALGASDSQSLFPASHKRLPAEIQSLNEAFMHMEQRLSENIQNRLKKKAMLDVILKNSPLGICKIDRKGIMTPLNPAMTDILGRPDTDLSEMAAGDCFDEHIQNQMTDILQQSDYSVMDDISVKHAEMEGEIRSSEGSFIPVEISVNLVEIDFQCLLLCIVKDISARKKQERLLRESQWNLEREIKARTNDLNTSNRLLKRKIMEHLEIEKSRWETEQRFTSIFEQAAVGIAILNDQGEFLQVNRKLSDILEYSRADLVGESLERLVTPEIQKQMLKHYSQMREDKANEFSMELSMFSKSRKPIHLNLFISHIQNTDRSVKYFIAVVEDITSRKIIENELIELKLKAETDHQSKNLFLINIATEIEKPAHDALNTVEQAMAAGPAVTLKRSLGKISESAHSVLRAADSLKSAISDATERARFKKNILLAEDDCIHQNYLHHYLTSAGHRVIIAENGAEAIEALKKNSIDVVLMDILMPEMDGVTATFHIRNDTSSLFDPNIPIIALTAYSMARDRKKFIETGMDAYFSKPIINIGELLRVIEEGAGEQNRPLDHSFPADTDIEANVRELFDLYKDRPARLYDMIDLFLTEVPGRMALLNGAIFEKDRNAGKQAAHKLTNALAFVRTPSLIQALVNVKKSIENHDFENAETAFREIREKIETICEILQNRNRIHTDDR